MITLKELKEKYLLKEGVLDLKKVIADGLDPHTATAMLAFDVENPTPNERRAAKNVNFSFLYGGTSCPKTLNSSGVE